MTDQDLIDGISADATSSEVEAAPDAAVSVDAGTPGAGEKTAAGLEAPTCETLDGDVVTARAEEMAAEAVSVAVVDLSSEVSFADVRAVMDRFLGQPISDDPLKVLDRVEFVTQMTHRLESHLMELGLAWALLNPPLFEGEDVKDAEDFPIPAGGQGAPEYRNGADQAFAQSAGVSASYSSRFIETSGEALARLPKTWAQVQAYQVPLWKIRKLTSLSVGLSAQAAAFLDDQIAPLITGCSIAQMKRATAAAQAAIEPETLEAQVAAEKQRRGLSFDYRNQLGGTINIFGILDTPDALSFKQLITTAAKTLVDQGRARDQGHGEAKALGMISRGELTIKPRQTTKNGEPLEISPTQVRLNIHFHANQLTTTSPNPASSSEATGLGVASVDGLDYPVLLSQVAKWCSKDATDIKVTPVIDLAAEYESKAYAPTGRLRDQVMYRYGQCVFPGCQVPSWRCDLDHIIPHSKGGKTCSCNLAPLCRRHHRAKTRRQWEYENTGDEFLWHYQHDHQQTKRQTLPKIFSTKIEKPIWWYSPEYLARQRHKAYLEQVSEIEHHNQFIKNEAQRLGVPFETGAGPWKYLKAPPLHPQDPDYLTITQQQAAQKQAAAQELQPAQNRQQQNSQQHDDQHQATSHSSGHLTDGSYVVADVWGQADNEASATWCNYDFTPYGCQHPECPSYFEYSHHDPDPNTDQREDDDFLEEGTDLYRYAKGIITEEQYIATLEQQIRDLGRPVPRNTDAYYTIKRPQHADPSVDATRIRQTYLAELHHIINTPEPESQPLPEYTEENDPWQI